MAARPPTGEDDDEPEAVTFGIAAVDEELDGADVTFPATASDVLDATGDPDVPYNVSGRTMPLSDALDETAKDSFGSRQELLDALHPVFEDRRQSAGPGIVEWLRGLLPV